MGKWTGVVTNAGNELLNGWVSGKTLRITAVDAGSGTVKDAALLAQTAVSGSIKGSGVSLTGYSRIPNGVQLRIQIAAPEKSYILRQLGVWAALDGGAPALLALYQNREGVPIQSRADYPDFAYTFYGAVAMGNTGEITVQMDHSALVTLEDLRDAIDRLKLEIFRNELTLPLATADGEELLTADGTPILAVYHPDKSASILAAMAAMDSRLSKLIGQTAASARSYTDSTGRAVLAGANAYTDGQIDGLEDRTGENISDASDILTAKIAAAKAEAISAASTDAAGKVGTAKTDLTAKIATAKAEAITAAGTDASTKVAAAKTDLTAQIDMEKESFSIAMDAKVLLHNADMTAHPNFLRVSENTVVLPKGPLMGSIL